MDTSSDGSQSLNSHSKRFPDQVQLAGDALRRTHVGIAEAQFRSAAVNASNSKAISACSMTPAQSEAGRALYEKPHPPFPDQMARYFMPTCKLSLGPTVSAQTGSDSPGEPTYGSQRGSSILWNVTGSARPPQGTSKLRNLYPVERNLSTLLKLVCRKI